MDKYIDNINANKTHLYFGARCHLNEENSCKVLSNIKQLTLTSHCFNLINYFIKNNYKPISELSDEIIENIRKYYRREINGRDLYYHDQYHICVSSINQYLYKWFNDMINLNKENIIYIDTNSIFYINDINVIDINIPYEIKYYKYGYFFRKQTYALIDEEYSLIKKGFSPNESIEKKFLKSAHTEFLSLIKKIEREKKLNNFFYE